MCNFNKKTVKAATGLKSRGIIAIKRLLYGIQAMLSPLAGQSLRDG